MLDLDKLRATKCPLCGGDNQCALAAQPSGAAEPATCWCFTATIPAAVLASIPEADRGVRCICPACAGVSEATT